MSTALVDTSVLTDALLKTGVQAQAARAAIERYSITQLPVYAIKEFKAGPLRAFIWFHNKLVTTGSLTETLTAIHQIARTPQRNLTATAIEALREAHQETCNLYKLGDLAQKYGDLADPEVALKDEYRLAIKARVFRAWRRRRGLTTEVVHPLDCYGEEDPRENRGLIESVRYRCRAGGPCRIAEILAGSSEALKKILAVMDNMDETPERKRCAAAIREVIRKPKALFEDSKCRALGDVVFAVLCPEGGVVLTTNIKDHEPLAAALGKSAERP